MSFRLKTIIGVAVIEATLLLVLVWTGINYLRATNEAELIKRASTTLTLLARASRDAVLSTDIATLEDIVFEATKTPELNYVRILNGRGLILAESGDSHKGNLPFSADRSYEEVDDNVYDTAIDISESSSNYGRIEIGLSTTHIDNVLYSAMQNASTIALLEMVLVALFSLALGTYLTRQLYGLTKAADKVASGEYGYQLDIKGSDELARTAAAFNRMSMELKLDREKQNAILRSALDAIISMDVKGRIVEFNQAAEDTFGYSRDEVLGRPMKDMIIPPSLRTAHEKGMSHYLATGESPIMDKRIQVTAMRASGEKFPAELAVTAVDISGRKLFTAFMRDISERIRNETTLKETKEAAEAADRAKTRFLAGMSHEIRTPLNALLGFLGLLSEQENITEEQLTWIRTAQQSGASLLHLINETLDFSRIEAGKMELDAHDFDIRELVESTMSALAPKAEAKGLKFTAGVDPAVPVRIVEDSGRLRQVLINLLDNAIKFTDSGSIELKVKAVDHNSLPCLHFSISDTGRGIPESEHDAVFGEFTRLAESGKLTSGTGLGLSIARRVVELMGGRIDYENRDNRGTCFWFEIPMAAASDTETEAEVSSLQEKAGRLPKSRILLADDSPANQMVALAMLRESGCTVDTASDGMEAVEAIRALPYDLVLMDISMPEMDGLQATGAIRELPGNTGSIPIIAMTAHAIVGDREKFIDAGMNDYLSKPITKQGLYEILEKWLPAGNADMAEDARNPASDETSPAILDTRVFDQLARDTSEEIVPRMLATFCKETRARLETLKQLGGDSTDIEQLQREAHTLKSSAATFGAIELQRVASNVEAACRNGEQALAWSMLDALQDSIEHTLAALEGYLAMPAGDDQAETASQ